MTAGPARAAPDTEPSLRHGASADASGRLGRAERHAALVSAAATLVAEHDVEAVSMEAVAARVGVSRALVYKHFANRDELLAAVYRREATALDAEIVGAVRAAEGFDAVVRTLIRAVLVGARTRGATFARLQRAGARDATLRAEQAKRDRRTVRYFARLANEEFGLPEPHARSAVRILLSGIDSVLAQWHAHPDREREQLLEDVYVNLMGGGLRALAAAVHADPRPPPSGPLARTSGSA
jgi:AcrR family transcriptional regulator